MEGLSIIKAAVDDDDDDGDEQQLLLAQPVESVVVVVVVVVRGGVKIGWDDIVRTVILLLFLCDVLEYMIYDVVRGEVPMKFRIGTTTITAAFTLLFVCLLLFVML
jgi:hypothetical protein